MDSRALIERLAANAEVLRGAFAGVSREEASWKPAPDSWSIVEVARHLLDEEREDFRTRLDLTLHHPETSWPPIDPEGWVVARHYADADLSETIADLVAERERSIAWLRGLTAPNWDQLHTHPRFGSCAAGALLASWVAHDYLHLRQIARLRHGYTMHLASPHPTTYAGRW